MKGLMLAPMALLLAAVGCSDVNDPVGPPGGGNGDGDGNGNGNGNGGEVTSTIVINEVSSSGSDRVEFFNTGDEAVDMSGWYYMDSKQDLPTAYVFPSGTVLGAGEYLVTNKNEHHLFGLGASDGVMLYDSSDTMVDGASWLDGGAEISWCRMPNGVGAFESCARPTFGYENTQAAAVCGNGIAEEPGELCDGDDLAGMTCESHGLGAGELRCAADCASFITEGCGARLSSVVINEVTSQGDDDVEFFNMGDTAVDMSGWKMSDDNGLGRDGDDIFIFADGTVLQPGEYLVIKNGSGEGDFSFGLGGSDEVNLYDADGNLLDHTGWPQDAARLSWCRLPNGVGTFQMCDQQTFGAENVGLPAPVCGDGIISGDEVCDGAAFGDLSCESLGMGPGTLSCATDCSQVLVDDCAAPTSAIVINEVTSQGNDDVEFFNAGDTVVDMSGWKMSDDNGLGRDGDDIYVFPAGTTLAPGAYLVIDGAEDFSFGLGGSDEVNLYDADNNLLDSTLWPQDAARVSWCRLPNGVGAFQICEQRTFGAENIAPAAPACGDGEISGDEVCDGANLGGLTCEGFGFGAGTLACATDCNSFITDECGAAIVNTVVINEVTSADDDDVEFFNTGDTAIDMSGWKMSDDARLGRDGADIYVFPAGTFIAPGQYLVIDGVTDFSFGLGNGGDEVNLYNAANELLDTSGAWPADGARVSWCRMPNGTGDFQTCDQRTFGAENVAPAPAVCGDGEITGDEVCDGTNLDGATCEDFGFGAGTLACAADCLSIVTDGCGVAVVTDVVINEVRSVDDHIEFFNKGTEAVDISGWKMSDDDGLVRDANGSIYTFPAGTVIPAGGYHVIYRDADLFFDFGLANGGDEVNLYNAANVLLDTSGAWPADGARVSWCRMPNGTGDFQTCDQSTMGEENVPAPADVCGDGAITGDEVCDGTDFGGLTCGSFSLMEGSLACAADCLSIIQDGCGGTLVNTVVINEVTSADNDDIEFFNTGSEIVDMSGWKMSDDARLGRDGADIYVFPAGTFIAPGQYLVIDGVTDFSFGLGNGGDEVNLYNAANELLDTSGAWPADGARVSWCRMPNGTGDFQTCDQRTFGGENVPAPADGCGDGEITGDEVCDGTDLAGLDCESFGMGPGMLACAADCSDYVTADCGAPLIFSVVINEVTSQDNDDVEFFNTGDTAVDMSGWKMSDDAGLGRDGADIYVFPAGTTIAPGAYLVIDGAADFSFGLGGSDEVNLYNDENVLLDTTAWPQDAARGSWCRMPNGEGDFQICDQRTFGAENVPAPASACGDGEISGDEVCDGTNFDGLSCESLGMGAGSLTCASECTVVLTDACSGPTSNVVINEVTSQGNDDVEFYNAGDTAVDMSGWKMSDDNGLGRDGADIYVFPAGTTLAPGAYLVIDGAADFSFGLGGSDEVNLYDADNNLLDSTGWPQDAARGSWCRLPNGDGPFGICDAQTFGAVNQ